MSPINLVPLLKDYEGQWVALADDYTVVYGAGKTAQAALQHAESQGHAEYTLLYVQPFNLLYSGSTVRDDRG